MVTYLNAATTDTIGYFYWSPVTVTALNSANFQHDYINLANLKVWHSHVTLNVPSTGNITGGANGATLNPATPNDLCNPAAGATAEVGGDAGGSVLLKQANADFLR